MGEPIKDGDTVEFSDGTKTYVGTVMMMTPQLIYILCQDNIVRLVMPDAVTKHKPMTTDHEPLHAGFRDAIHVPFIVVSCDETVRPGDKCSLRNDNKCIRWTKTKEEPMWHGVADPFREDYIESGNLFRVYLRKECFHGLRHDFQIEVHDRGGTDTCHSVCDIF